MTLDPLVVFGALGTIAAGVIPAGKMRVWVWGWVLEDKEKQLAEERTEKIFWRTAALRAMGHAEKALGTTEKAIGIATSSTTGDG
jgi:hypothetical protein